LLIRRGSPPAKGTWSLPGGKVEPGETHAEAAAREVAEETGLVVDVGELIGTSEFSRYVVHDFRATVIGGTLAAGDDASDARWYTAAEVRDLDTSPGLLDWLDRMRIL
jgi:ADP-ribose pyrophosphatase YjhB (NUDIX family)